VKILITGGAGYIGSHIALECIRQGHKVTVFDNLSSGFIENIHNGVAFHKGSTLSNEDISKVMESSDFDAVIHMAAYKAAGESMINPSQYSTNNIIGGMNIINACIKYNIDKFVFSSTASVYGKPLYIPIDEDHSLNPINYYGFSKLSIENNLEWFSKLKDIKYASLRYFNAAGFDKDGKIFCKEKTPQNLIPLVMEVATKKRKVIDIYGNDYNTKDGTGIRDYIHVSDLSRGHIAALEYIDTTKNNLILNLGTGIGHSVLDVISKTKLISNKNIVFNFVDRRVGDPEIVIASSEKAKNTINWNPQFSDLDTIIKTTWNIYNK
tara:strand:+ start:412 stop:1380 length:969 start_codon:yes stop_codon:yes gene_type:complete